MAKVSDIKHPDKLKILVYGDSGTGKTYSIATYPSPVYVMDFDRGIDTLAGIVGEEFEYDSFYDRDPRKPEAFQEFRKKVAELRRECPYKTVVLDSVTSLGEKAITNFVRVGSGHVDSPLELQDHLRISDKLAQSLDELLGINAHIVVISHPKIIQVEETGELKYLAMQTGNKLPQRVPLYFDEIYKSDKILKKGTRDEFDYVWQTRSDRRWSARSRFNYINEDGYKRPILEMIEPQDLTRILDKVRERRG